MPVSPCGMKSCSTASNFRLLVIRVVLGLLPAFSFAQTVWDNGNGNNAWGTGANWSSNSVPVAGSNVQFNATDDNATVSNITLGGNRVANSLTFSNVNDNFSLINGSGSRSLTLTSGDITRTAGSTGTQTLAFATLALGGDAAMNIAGAGSLIISSDVINSGGTRSLTKSGAGELILSGDNTFSGGTTVSAGTLTLNNISALGTGSTLTLSGGTLKLSTASTTVTTLNVTATSTIDFGGANASLSLTNLTIAANVTLNIINWVNAADFFVTQNWTGAAFDTTGANPMSQVVFNSPTYSGDNTKWQAYDKQITPVPEPSAYGAALLGFGGALVTWRRRARK
jgi:autotransporter-associated beta strand protein